MTRFAVLASLLVFARAEFAPSDLAVDSDEPDFGGNIWKDVADAQVSAPSTVFDLMKSIKAAQKELNAARTGARAIESRIWDLKHRASQAQTYPGRCCCSVFNRKDLLTCSPLRPPVSYSEPLSTVLKRSSNPFSSDQWVCPGFDTELWSDDQISFHKAKNEQQLALCAERTKQELAGIAEQVQGEESLLATAQAVVKDLSEIHSALTARTMCRGLSGKQSGFQCGLGALSRTRKDCEPSYRRMKPGKKRKQLQKIYTSYAAQAGYTYNGNNYVWPCALHACFKCENPAASDNDKVFAVSKQSDPQSPFDHALEDCATSCSGLPNLSPEGLEMEQDLEALEPQDEETGWV